MKTITLRDYNRISSDFRGIWNTERDDQPNWAQDRDKYMGKRTMMAGDGSCSLLIEGLSFRITEYRKYLIFAGHHAAIIDLPYGLSSDDYGRLQDWFAKLTNGDSYSSMRSLDEQERVGEVYYYWELAGPGGASFELFKFPETSAESAQKAEDHIRRNQDVVRLAVRYFRKLHDIQSQVDVLFS